MVTRVELVHCLRAGKAAAERPGATALDCPYSPTGDAAERLRVAAWMHAFLRAQRSLARAA